VPLAVGTLRDTLGQASLFSIHKHLSAWRAARAQDADTPGVEVPAQVTAALGAWARQQSEEARAGLREDLSQLEGELGAKVQRATRRAAALVGRLNMMFAP